MAWGRRKSRFRTRRTNRFKRYKRRRLTRRRRTRRTKDKQSTIRKFSWVDYIELTVPTDYPLEFYCNLNKASFKLDDKASMTTEANHWDQYKWLKTKVTWRPAWGNMDLTQMNVNSGGISIFGMPYWATKVDHDDAVSPITTMDDIIKDGGHHGVFNKPRSITFRPTALNMVYKGVTTTGYAVPKVTPWIDCVDTGVPHYGLRWGIGIRKDASTKASTIPYYLQVTHWIAFKSHLQALGQGGNF